MKNMILSVLLIILSPFIAFAKVIWSIIKSAFNFLLKLPAQILSSLVDRIFDMFRNINRKLDEHSRKKSEQENKRHLTRYIEKLLNTDNILGNSSAAKAVKLLTIIILQFVSFFTTYYGLYQLFSAINPVIPLMLAFVIQLGLAFLCTKVSSVSAPKSYSWLLGIFLTISIAFSYIGVSYTVLPYRNYARECYSEVSVVLNDGIERLREASSNGESPVAQIESAYESINGILSSAKKNYGESALQEAQTKRDEYSARTVPESEEEPIYYFYDDYGNLLQSGGGKKVINVKDPEALALIAMEDERIELIKDVIARVETISEQLSGVCEKSSLISVVEKQMERPEELTDEFVQASSSFGYLIESTSALAEKIKEPFSVNLDLQNLMFRYRDNSIVKSLDKLPDFDDIYSEWSEDPGSVVSTDFWENLRQSMIKLYDYSSLKQTLDEKVSNAYKRLSEACALVDYPTDSIAETYNSYNLMIPLSYDYSLLNPLNPDFKSALLSLIVSIVNDGLSVLIGIFMVERKVNWAARKTSDKDITRYIFTQFKSVITPMLIEVPVNADNPEVYYRWFIDLMNAFLNQFDISEKLNDTEFSRYFIGEIHDDRFRNIFSFLSDFALIKFTSADEMVSLGLLKSEKEIGANEHCMLLTKKGELWLTDIIGGPADELIKLFSEY